MSARMRKPMLLIIITVLAVALAAGVVASDEPDQAMGTSASSCEVDANIWSEFNFSADSQCHWFMDDIKVKATLQWRPAAIWYDIDSVQNTCNNVDECSTGTGSHSDPDPGWWRTKGEVWSDGDYEWDTTQQIPVEP